MSDSEQEDNKNSSGKILRIPFLTNKNDILERYEERKGKSIFLRFPEKLPTDQNELNLLVKSLCDRIIRVRRLRQKSSRGCLVDFNTKKDRDESLKQLKAVKINGSKLVANIPKTENEDVLKSLIEKRESQQEKKRLKKKMLREAIKAKKIQSSSFVIRNIPHDIPTSEIRELFPNSIEILRTSSKKNRKGETRDFVNIKFPSIEEARTAKLAGKLLRGKPLQIVYDISKYVSFIEDFPKLKIDLGPNQLKNKVGKMKKQNQVAKNNDQKPKLPQFEKQVKGKKQVANNVEKQNKNEKKQMIKSLGNTQPQLKLGKNQKKKKMVKSPGQDKSELEKQDKLVSNVGRNQPQLMKLDKKQKKKQMIKSLGQSQSQLEDEKKVVSTVEQNQPQLKKLAKIQKKQVVKRLGQSQPHFEKKDKKMKLGIKQPKKENAGLKKMNAKNKSKIPMVKTN